MGWNGREYIYDEDPRTEEWHERECCPWCESDTYEDLYVREVDGEVVGCTDCIKYKF
jgi:hypothetical protein